MADVGRLCRRVDYILAAFESPDVSALQRTGRAALHTIHGLFSPPDRSGQVNGKDPKSKRNWRPAMRAGRSLRN